MSGEYYRADILARAGLPVDQPVHMSGCCPASRSWSIAAARIAACPMFCAPSISRTTQTFAALLPKLKAG